MAATCPVPAPKPLPVQCQFRCQSLLLLPTHSHSHSRLPGYHFQPQTLRHRSTRKPAAAPSAGWVCVSSCGILCSGCSLPRLRFYLYLCEYFAYFTTSYTYMKLFYCRRRVVWWQPQCYLLLATHPAERNENATALHASTDQGEGIG